MNLNEILLKTKNKSEKISIIRKPPSIATYDRPYSVEEIIINTDNIETETDNKSETNRKQIGNKSKANRKQIGNKSETYRKQDNPICSTNNEKWKQIGNKSETKSETEVET